MKKIKQVNQLLEPLASRMRPTSLTQFMGQTELIGKGKILRKMIDQDQVTSMIFWGPPGVGKTTLAEIIAKQTKAQFLAFSAVNTGIKEIKKIMEAAKQDLNPQKIIVFIDEIHRFNKAQQDALLPYVEKGNIILIGATTENPSFEVNSALLSRCKVFVLKYLTTSELIQILKNAIQVEEESFGNKIKIEAKAFEAIAGFANGDARVALNTFEMAILNSPKSQGEIQVQEKTLLQILNKKSFAYDKGGEEHYNIISALHKSMRNSDVDAAIYWLNRMIEGGEDPLYIARRLVRFASEDIGLADTNALNLTINVFQACQFLGVPECDVHLNEAVIYLSLAPKSNAVYLAKLNVIKDVKKTANEPVPLQIRNAPTKLMDQLGYGHNYQYAHDYKDKLTTMETMPLTLKGHEYYFPTEEGVEKKFKARKEMIEAWKKEHKI